MTTKVSDGAPVNGRHDPTDFGRNQAEIFLRTLYQSEITDDQYIELRAIRNNQVDTAFFKPNQEVKEALDFGEAYSSERHVYVGIHPRGHEPTSGAGTNESVLIYLGHHADLDQDDFEDGKAEAQEQIKRFPLKPTVVVDSGYGLHGYWLFEEPIFVPPHSDNRHLLQAQLTVLQRRLNADTTNDIARILRLPGTTNIKHPDFHDPDSEHYRTNSNNPSDWVSCELETNGGPRYKPLHFEKVLDSSAVEEAKQTHSSLSEGGFDGRAVSESFLKKELPEHVWNRLQTIPEGNENDRSKNDFAFACGAFRAGLSPEEVKGAFKLAREKGFVLGEKFKERGSEYLNLTINKSYDKVFGSDPENISQNGASLDSGNRKLLTTRVSDVQSEEIEWLWQNRLARGKLHLLDGDPGLGKSTLTLDLASKLSNGKQQWPDGHNTPEDAQNTIILTAEDDVADTIRPRLEAHGASLDKIHVVEGLESSDSDQPLPFTIPEDLGQLEAFIRKHNAALLVIDPLMAYLGQNHDSHRDQDVRRALHPLADVAARTGVAVLCIRHLRKSPGRNPLYRGGGSIGIIGAARIGWLLASHPDKPSANVLAPLKSNLGPKPESLAFRLEPDGLTGPPKVNWLGPVNLTAQDLLGNTRSSTKKDEAISWLKEQLAEGPQPANDLIKGAEQRGISESTLRRAKKELEVESEQPDGETSPGWMWLPPGENESEEKC